MEQYRQNTYVERELRRRRIERRYRTMQKVKECLIGIAMIIGCDVFMLSLCII